MLTFLNRGTTSGFGRRLVKSALRRGDRVIATGRSSEKLQNVVTSCDPEFRANLRTLQLDVTEGITSLKAKADEAAAIWGQIDVLVNNAGEVFSIAGFKTNYLTHNLSGVGFPSILEEGGYGIPFLNRIGRTQMIIGLPP